MALMELICVILTLFCFQLMVIFGSRTFISSFIHLMHFDDDDEDELSCQSCGDKTNPPFIPDASAA